MGGALLGLGGSQGGGENNGKEEETGDKDTRLSQQATSDSLLHRPQNKASLPTLPIPLKVCVCAKLCLYPCQKIILQNGVSDRQPLQPPKGYFRCRA